MSDWKRRQGKRKKRQDFEELDFEDRNLERQDYRKQDPAAQWDEDMSLRDEGEREEEWEEDPKPLAPWVMALIFLGMILLAALICLVLWRFTHPGQGGSDQEPPAQVTAGPGVTADPAGTSGPETTAEPAATSGPEATPEPAATPAPETTSEPAVTPGATQKPQSGVNSDGQTKDPIAGNAAMTFSELEESVTPKDVVNLRSVPTTTDETNIVVQAKNGEVLQRTGINQDTGWSRIDYGGQTLYAVNQYLTTDLNYKTPVQPSDPNRVNTVGGRIIIFTDCDDWISPKDYVNLRTEPSTSEGNATVSCQLNYGEKAHRTGYSADAGWSRVEYNGQVLYVVTSLMYEVTE